MTLAKPLAMSMFEVADLSIQNHFFGIKNEYYTVVGKEFHYANAGSMEERPWLFMMKLHSLLTIVFFMFRSADFADSAVQKMIFMFF